MSDRLTELKLLMHILDKSDASSKLKDNIKRMVIPLYRREYMTDICGYKEKERDRLREDFDTLFPIPKKE